MRDERAIRCEDAAAVRVEQSVARIVRARGDARRLDNLDEDLANHQQGEQQDEKPGEVPYGAVGHASRKTVKPPWVRTAMCGWPASPSRSAFTTVAAIESSTPPTVST